MIGTNTGQTYTAELHSVNTDTLAGGMAYYNFLVVQELAHQEGATQSECIFHKAASRVCPLANSTWELVARAEASHSARGKRRRN